MIKKSSNKNLRSANKAKKDEFYTQLTDFEILGCSYNYGRPKGWDDKINMSVSIGKKNI